MEKIPPIIRIREERPENADEIFRIHEKAFSRREEANLSWSLDVRRIIHVSVSDPLLDMKSDAPGKFLKTPFSCWSSIPPTSFAYGDRRSTVRNSTGMNDRFGFQTQPASTI